MTKEKIEVICETCNGAGTVASTGQVYPNEPHTAFMYSEPCPDCVGSWEEDGDQELDQDR